jgi:glycosyltransferase involved in cell wall biosynthesis
MKICFVIPSLAGGGAERVAVTVLSALDGARHDRVLYLFSGDGVYFDRIAPGVRVVVAGKPSRFGRLFEFARFLRAERPDVVMPFLSYFITALAVWIARVPARVVFNQGTPTTGFLEDPDFSWRAPGRRWLFAVFTRLFYGRADAVVVTSEGVATDLVENYGVPRTKIRVLHNPVDIDTIKRESSAPIDGIDLSHDRPAVAAAGRLAGVKNYPLLIAAIAEIASAPLKGCPTVHAWILGDGVERAALEQLVARSGVTSLVRFLGFQKNPWRFIARADVFVLTSTYEGFGNVLIEAMACGTPVVATRSPGTIEIIEHESNGLLVDHEATAVAAAISRLLGDASLRARLVSRAKESVGYYATPLVADRYDRLFQELVA